MIFVTVGTHSQGFERLIKKMDEIASKINEEVIAQIGSTSYRPKNMIFFTFVGDEKRLVELYKKARVIVTHGGVGTILTALGYEKPLVVVPRLKKFNEVVDDHQLELAEVLGRNGRAIVVYDIRYLENALKKVPKLKYKENIKSSLLISFLKDYVEELKK